jgi:hypothetical protein
VLLLPVRYTLCSYGANIRPSLEGTQGVAMAYNTGRAVCVDTPPCKVHGVVHTGPTEPNVQYIYCVCMVILYIWHRRAREVCEFPSLYAHRSCRVHFRLMVLPPYIR